MDAGLPRVEFEAHGRIASAVRNHDRDIIIPCQKDLIGAQNSSIRPELRNRATTRNQVRQAASLIFPVFAVTAWPLQSATGKNSIWTGLNGRSAASYKVIGIGGAGTSIVLAIRSMLAFDGFSKMPKLELICVDFGTDHLRRIADACEAAPDWTPIKTMSIAPSSASGWVNRARVLALRQRENLKAFLAGADTIVLVAGLGGGAGGVTPIMARLAREAGALTVAAVVRPFAFEEGLNPLAGNALRYLRSESDVVVEFSNEEWAKRHGEDALLKEVIASHDRHIAGCIRELIKNAA